MRPYTVSTLFSVAALAVLGLPQVTLAKTPAQVRSCRNFVGRALEIYNPASISRIQITQTSIGQPGETTMNWLLADGLTNGSCVVNAQGEIIEYRRGRGPTTGGVPTGGTPDLSWGREVAPYAAQIATGAAQNLFSRPLDGARPIGLVNGGENVSITRTYTDPSNSWVLVRNNSGQQGWLNARNLFQVTGNAPYGNNPQVEYSWGQEIRPVNAQVSYGSLAGAIFGTANYELVTRPDNPQGPGRSVGLVAGGERVTVYRQVAVGSATWVLVKGSRGQEGWIESRRLIQL